mgnify:CR=1 FL=1
MAVFVAGDDGRYLAANAYACELLGYTRSELLDLRVRDVAVDPDAQIELLGDEAHRLANGHDSAAAKRRNRGRDVLPRLTVDGRRDAGLHRDLLAGGVS